MATWVRIGIGVLVRGTVLGALLFLLRPRVWSRDDFESFEYASWVFVFGGGWLGHRSAEPLGRWVRTAVLFSIGLAATMIAGFALIGALFGEGTLSSASQRTVFGTAVGIAGCFWGWLHLAARMPRFADPGRESRREGIRANIRAEIAEIERSAGGGTARPEER